MNGIEGKLLENVLARLEINKNREKSQLSVKDVERLHNNAEKDIQSGLAPYGYYDPVISTKLSHKDEVYTAIYTVNKGKPVRVSAVDVQVVGDGKKELKKILGPFPLKVGDICNQGQYEEGKKSLSVAAMRRGFMRSRFEVQELRINRREKTAEIQLVLETGPQFVFGETTFRSDYLKTELLERYLPYKAGDPYRPGKLIELQKLLYQTEFFNRVVVNGRVNNAENLVVPVNVRLEVPKFLNRYTVGMGYATDTGARIRLEWWNRLLNTRGHQLRTSVQAGQNDSNVMINYAVPWLDPKKDKFSYNIAYHEQSWDDTDTNLFTAGIQMEHKGDLLRHGGSFEFRSEDYSVGDTSGSAIFFMPTYTGTVILADDLLNTKYGLELSVSVSGASKNLGSDANFVKTVFNGKTIVTLIPGLRVIGRGSFGTTAVDNINDLPPSLRFYTGGDQSVRGYAYKSLGTKDSSGAVVGGRYLMVGSGEIEKSITENWSCAAFWDVGNAFDDIHLKLKQGVGGGIRYRLPFGQVRLDIASAVSEDGAPLRIHLTVGADL